MPEPSLPSHVQEEKLDLTNAAPPLVTQNLELWRRANHTQPLNYIRVLPKQSEVEKFTPGLNKPVKILFDSWYDNSTENAMLYPEGHNHQPVTAAGVVPAVMGEAGGLSTWTQPDWEWRPYTFRVNEMTQWCTEMNNFADQQNAQGKWPQYRFDVITDANIYRIKKRTKLAAGAAESTRMMVGNLSMMHSIRIKSGQIKPLYPRHHVTAKSASKARKCVSGTVAHHFVLYPQQAAPITITAVSEVDAYPGLVDHLDSMFDIGLGVQQVTWGRSDYIHLKAAAGPVSDYDYDDPTRAVIAACTDLFYSGDHAYSDAAHGILNGIDRLSQSKFEADEPISIYDIIRSKGLEDFDFIDYALQYHFRRCSDPDVISNLNLVASIIEKRYLSLIMTDVYKVVKSDATETLLKLLHDGDLDRFATRQGPAVKSTFQDRNLVTATAELSLVEAYSLDYLVADKHKHSHGVKDPFKVTDAETGEIFVVVIKNILDSDKLPDLCDIRQLEDEKVVFKRGTLVGASANSRTTIDDGNSSSASSSSSNVNTDQQANVAAASQVVLTGSADSEEFGFGSLSMTSSKDAAASVFLGKVSFDSVPATASGQIGLDLRFSPTTQLAIQGATQQCFGYTKKNDRCKNRRYCQSGQLVWCHFHKAQVDELQQDLKEKTFRVAHWKPVASSTSLTEASSSCSSPLNQSM